MASKPIKIIWECSECGVRNERNLNSCDLTCDACGANEFEFGNSSERYKFTIAQNHTTFPSVLESKPFAKVEDLPQEIRKLIKTHFPQFASTDTWSGFSVFDLLWMSMAQPELTWHLPFEELSKSAWAVIGDCCKQTPFYFKRFIASKSTFWLKSVIATDITIADLHCAIDLYKRQDWFEKNSEVLKGFATFIHNIVTKKREFNVIVSSLPKILQFEILQLSPDCPGLPNNILKDLDPDISVRFLSDSDKKDKILCAYPFEKFTAMNWQKALRVVSGDGDQTDRFKESLWSAWDSINLGNNEIYSILDSNPSVCYLLPLDRFTVSQFLYLLSLVRIDGLDLTAYCPFEKFSVKDWVQLLMNHRIPSSSNIEDAVREYDVIAKLSKAERFRILESNPNAIRYFNINAIPSEKAVEIYLKYPNVMLPSSLIFMSCSKELVKKLLSECGDRVPICTQELLRLNIEQAFSSEELNAIIKANSALGFYIPTERIKELVPEIFMDLAIKYKGARFLTFNYDLNSLKLGDRKKLIKLYPWVSVKIDPSEWTCADVYEVAKFSPEIVDRYPHKVAYFKYVHAFIIWLIVCNCIISLIVLFVLACYRM